LNTALLTSAGFPPHVAPLVEPPAKPQNEKKKKKNHVKNTKGFAQ
jgi:hypothetical protein